ncbi:hypothetical protein GEMRC1_007286 [Eukaryota sp. GEM-RC1]
MSQIRTDITINENNERTSHDEETSIDQMLSPRLQEMFLSNQASPCEIAMRILESYHKRQADDPCDQWILPDISPEWLELFQSLDDSQSPIVFFSLALRHVYQRYHFEQELGLPEVHLRYVDFVFMAFCFASSMLGQQFNHSTVCSSANLHRVRLFAKISSRFIPFFCLCQFHLFHHLILASNTRLFVFLVETLDFCPSTRGMSNDINEIFNFIKDVLFDGSTHAQSKLLFLTFNLCEFVMDFVSADNLSGVPRYPHNWSQLVKQYSDSFNDLSNGTSTTSFPMPRRVKCLVVDSLIQRCTSVLEGNPRNQPWSEVIRCFEKLKHFIGWKKLTSGQYLSVQTLRQIATLYRKGKGTLRNERRNDIAKKVEEELHPRSVIN